MPMKIDQIKLITVQKRPSVVKEQELFKKEVIRTGPVNYCANNVMRNSNFNKLQNFVFRMVDKITPIIRTKHPKLSSGLIKISENILKKSHVAE